LSSPETTVGGLHSEVAGEGTGIPLVLVHSAITFDGCRPFLERRELTSARPVVHYYRRGYRGAPPSPGFSIADQAADARRVITALGHSRVHVLGHSVGTLVALQLALESPALVESLVLVEPAFGSRPELLAAFEAALAPAIEAYSKGDARCATDQLLSFLDGDDYRATLGAALSPGWFDDAVSVLDLYFKVDLPAALAWNVGPGELARIAAPVLILKGSDSPHLLRSAADDVAALLPSARVEDIDGATHNVIGSRPAAAAAAVERFLHELTPRR
jgi:pimeloyl-ACP methyl ester carboxylesterase